MHLRTAAIFGTSFLIEHHHIPDLIL